MALTDAPPVSPPLQNKKRRRGQRVLYISSQSCRFSCSCRSVVANAFDCFISAIDSPTQPLHVAKNRVSNFVLELFL